MLVDVTFWFWYFGVLMATALIVASTKLSEDRKIALIYGSFMFAVFTLPGFVGTIVSLVTHDFFSAMLLGGWGLLIATPVGYSLCKMLWNRNK
jgi:succinate-acetate transporter protein